MSELDLRQQTAEGFIRIERRLARIERAIYSLSPLLAFWALAQIVERRIDDFPTFVVGLALIGLIGFLGWQVFYGRRDPTLS